MENQNPNIVIVRSEKSMAVTLLLTFFFGPLGMFYSTVTGGVVMLIVSVILAVVTLGLSLILTWPICMIWAAVETNKYNKSLALR
jgi:hypothetical protein